MSIDIQPSQSSNNLSTEPSEEKHQKVFYIGNTCFTYENMLDIEIEKMHFVRTYDNTTVLTSDNYVLQVGMKIPPNII
jgi:hypothetical protein